MERLLGLLMDNSLYQLQTLYTPSIVNWPEQRVSEVDGKACLQSYTYYFLSRISWGGSWYLVLLGYDVREDREACFNGEACTAKRV